MRISIFSFVPILLKRSNGFLQRSIGEKYVLDYSSTPMVLFSAPKRGSVVDKYQTINIFCVKCRKKLFRYKKKNGTKSNLVKMYIERIVDDPLNVLTNKETNDLSGTNFTCPSCMTSF